MIGGARRILTLPKAPYGAIFLIALLARVTAVLWRGGYGGYANYDSSVYYTAAAALIRGEVPYRDFTLVHPPGSMLVLTPFAWIGSHTTDRTGYLLGNLAFTVIGAAAAVLVALVVRELTPSRLAVWTGGLAYALYVGAVNAEREARLEPLANLLLLVGLLCLLRAPRTRWPTALLGGAALAGSVSVKIWYAVPAGILLLGYLATTRRSRFLPALVGVTLSLAVIDGPFLLAAPRAMFRRVISDQLDRPPHIGTRKRFVDISGLSSWIYPRTLSPLVEGLVAGIVVAVLALVAGTAATQRNARLPALLLVAQTLTLYLAPSYFPFYSDYLTPAAAVCVGVSVGVLAAWVVRRRRAGRRAPGRRAATLVLAAVTLCSLVLGAVSRLPYSHAYPKTRFADAVSDLRCVTSNSPGALIQLNVLTRDFDNGCRNWVDVLGRRLGPDRNRPDDVPIDQRWQRDLARYLLSGDAVTLIEPQNLNMNDQLQRVLGNAPVLARTRDFCVVRVTDVQRRQYRDLLPLPRVYPLGVDRASVQTPWCGKPGPDFNSGQAAPAGPGP